MVAAALFIAAAGLYLSAMQPASPLLGILGAFVEIAAWVVAYFAQPKEVRRAPGDDSPHIKLP